MATGTRPPRTARTRLAVAGARAATVGSLTAPAAGRRVREFLFPAVLFLGLSVALTGLAALIIWAVVQGGERVNLGLVTNGPSAINPEQAGYRTAILGSLWVIGGVIVLIVPLGTGAAIYLEEFADRTRWYHRLFELNIQNLAGVPSIVFGILGLAFIVRGPLQLGFVAAAGSITVALLVLPTVIIAALEAIRAVPSSVRQGAMALGATKWQTVWHQVLPAARSGILTGVILAVARAIGEAAPLLLVGAVTFTMADPSFFEGSYTTLPVQIYDWARRPQEELRTLAAAGILVMLALVLAMNSVAVWLRNRYEQKW
ncbi:MAG TPA: phosphate ABC transporter permease PstA [Natronosporangium sp.]|nr:phosphate ABC transporter permease PstA [Natronosporangium sp.]